MRSALLVMVFLGAAGFIAALAGCGVASAAPDPCADLRAQVQRLEVENAALRAVNASGKRWPGAK
jgi:hypothetical protein